MTKKNHDLNWAVLCDFDGTISRQDVSDHLLRRFGQPGWRDIEAQWEAGHIGSRACMTAQIALLDMSQDDLVEALAEIELDPMFPAFLDVVRARQMPIEILSDGLAQAIRIILDRSRITDIPIYANDLQRIAPRQWRLDTPYASATCARASAHCKCVQRARQDRPVLFIGDGASDFCVAQRADFVLAKGRLADFCRDQGIAHCAITDFNDALLFMTQSAVLEEVA